MDYMDVTRSLINVAQGLEPADMVITGGRVFNVFTGEVLDGFSVGIKKKRIAYVGKDPKNAVGKETEVIDVDG
ncbi:MAG: adenosine deaminase, partial [Deltaproteobacteria bacterium]|nr:adenosine deaminase [Deltaproteobacteria bacterium]